MKIGMPADEGDGFFHYYESERVESRERGGKANAKLGEFDVPLAKELVQGWFSTQRQQTTDSQEHAPDSGGHHHSTVQTEEE